MKGKVLFLLLGIVVVSVFSSCNGDKYYFLDFKNKTGEEIRLVSFLLYDETKYELSTWVSSGDSTRLYSGVAMSDAELVFLFNGKEYMVKAGYTDYYPGFTVEVSKSPDSPYGIKATFIGKSIWMGDEKEEMEITEVTED